MQKIPTVFERDWNGDRSRVIDVVHPGCEWVLAGEGIATRKLDGTCCMVRAGRLYKRLETKKAPPAGFEEVEFDEKTGKRVGWVPVGDGPEDRWHREAFSLFSREAPVDGTYELIGPKVQGNPEGAATHVLVRHDDAPVYELAPLSFGPLREWLSGKDIEGIVWHHPDGRMAKIKLRDFGIKRATPKGSACQE